MSNIEKIRQEIENSIKAFELNGGIYDAYEGGELAAYKELLAFLDTLSEEPDKSLEEAARLYAIPHYMKDIDVNHIEEYPYDTGLEAAFIAGAKWQKKQMLKDAVEFECISKKVKMTVKELIDYYINTECCEVAEECGF